MPHYEYQLLEMQAAELGKLQERVNALAREGFRYRDTISKTDGGAVIIFEREAEMEIGDAWSAARLAASHKKPSPGKAKLNQVDPKYPPEDDDE